MAEPAFDPEDPCEFEVVDKIEEDDWVVEIPEPEIPEAILDCFQEDPPIPPADPPCPTLRIGNLARQFMSTDKDDCCEWEIDLDPEALFDLLDIECPAISQLADGPHSLVTSLEATSVDIQVTEGIGCSHQLTPVVAFPYTDITVLPGEVVAGGWSIELELGGTELQPTLKPILGYEEGGGGDPDCNHTGTLFFVYDFAILDGQIRVMYKSAEVVDGLICGEADEGTVYYDYCCDSTDSDSASNSESLDWDGCGGIGGLRFSDLEISNNPDFVLTLTNGCLTLTPVIDCENLTA